MLKKTPSVRYFTFEFIAKDSFFVVVVCVPAILHLHDRIRMITIINPNLFYTAELI